MREGERDASLDDRFDPAVRMVEHQAVWRTAAALEGTRLLNALAPWAVTADHVGSTAVAGMPAKPIIDLQISVAGVGEVKRHIDAFSRLGYAWVHDPGSPAYVLFVRPKARPRTHHVHVCESGSRDELRHLAVRDYLRAQPQEAVAYGELKRRLTSASPGNRLEYMAGKDAYVAALERRALHWAGSRTDGGSA